MNSDESSQHHRTVEDEGTTVNEAANNHEDNSPSPPSSPSNVQKKFDSLNGVDDALPTATVEKSLSHVKSPVVGSDPFDTSNTQTTDDVDEDLTERIDLDLESENKTCSSIGEETIKKNDVDLARNDDATASSMKEDAVENTLLKQSLGFSEGDHFDGDRDELMQKVNPKDDNEEGTRNSVEQITHDMPTSDLGHKNRNAPMSSLVVDREFESRHKFSTQQVPYAARTIDETGKYATGRNLDPNDAGIPVPPQDTGFVNNSDVNPSAFELLVDRKLKKRKTSITKPISIRISLPSRSGNDLPMDETNKQQEVKWEATHSCENNDFIPDEIDEDHVDFHDVDDKSDREDQNINEAQPEAQSSKEKEHQLQTRLAEFYAEKEADLAKVMEFLNAKWDESSKKMQTEVKQIIDAMLAKQERQRTQLADKHKRQLDAEERKVEEGMSWLLRQQQMEVEKNMLNRPQPPQSGTDPKQMTEWNNYAIQMQTHHSQQLQQFEEKKLELRRKSEQELHAQNAILFAHHKKRKAETDKHVEEIEKQCREKHENLKAKLLRTHEEKFEKKLRDIRSQNITVASKVPDPSSCVEPKSGTNNGLSSFLFDPSISHHAVTRHKRRKISMNNAPFGIAIEIHNEGIIVMTRTSETERAFANSASRMSLFIPWGSKARSVLYSVMCGEIPSDINGLYVSARRDLDGGSVRCMITDMRTSEDTAICDRAEAFSNHLAALSKTHIDRLTQQHATLNIQISNLSKEYKEAVTLEENAVKAHRDAEKAHINSKETWARFKLKAQQFFDADGSLSAHVSSDNQQKLLNAMHRYKKDFEHTKQQMTILHRPLEGARMAITTKRMELEKAKDALKEVDTSLKKIRNIEQTKSALNLISPGSSSLITEEDLSGRIENIITAIHLSTDKRRAMVNQKKTNSRVCSTWDKHMDDSCIDSSAKMCLWQKMQRRRINTVLRPSHQSILREITKDSYLSPKTDNFDMGQDDSTAAPSLRNEELLLLALHPESPTVLPTPVPDYEPGWHLHLDPPQPIIPNPYSFFPVDSEMVLPQTFLSVCCSTGRQISSFIKRSHLLMLSDDSPMSFSLQASSPAESNPSCHKKATKDLINADPLSESEEQLKLGYSFVMRNNRMKSSTPDNSKTTKSHTSMNKKEKAQKTSPSFMSKSNPPAKKQRIVKQKKERKSSSQKGKTQSNKKKPGMPGPNEQRRLQGPSTDLTALLSIGRQITTTSNIQNQMPSMQPLPALQQQHQQQQQQQQQQQVQFQQMLIMRNLAMIQQQQQLERQRQQQNSHGHPNQSSQQAQPNIQQYQLQREPHQLLSNRQQMQFNYLQPGQGRLSFTQQPQMNQIVEQNNVLGTTNNQVMFTQYPGRNDKNFQQNSGDKK